MATGAISAIYRTAVMALVMGPMAGTAEEADQVCTRMESTMPPDPLTCPAIFQQIRGHLFDVRASK